MVRLDLCIHASEAERQKQIQGFNKTQTDSVTSLFWITMIRSQNNQFVDFDAW
jgi:hypothetical protein